MVGESSRSQELNLASPPLPPPGGWGCFQLLVGLWGGVWCVPSGHDEVFVVKKVRRLKQVPFSREVAEEPSVPLTEVHPEEGAVPPSAYEQQAARRQPRLNNDPGEAGRLVNEAMAKAPVSVRMTGVGWVAISVTCPPWTAWCAAPLHPHYVDARAAILQDVIAVCFPC